MQWLEPFIPALAGIPALLWLLLGRFWLGPYLNRKKVNGKLPLSFGLLGMIVIVVPFMLFVFLLYDPLVGFLFGLFPKKP